MSVAGNPSSSTPLWAPAVHGPFPDSISRNCLSASSSDRASGVVALEQFVQDLFTFKFDDGFFIALLTAGVFLAVLVLVGTIVILYRIWHGKFWVIRFMRRSEGIYVVPNALNAFTLLEGAFGALWFAYVWVIIYAYHKNRAALQHSVDAFNMLVWLPLYLGALYAAVGSFYTAPGALDSGRLEKQWAFHRIIRRPWIINSIALGTPLILAGCLIPCAVYSQRHLSRSYEGYQSFAVDASRTATVSAAQGQAFLTQAGDIWNDLAGGKRWLGIGYAIWTAFAALLLLFYIPAGGYMLKLVNAQAQTQHDMVRKIERQQQEMLEAEQLQRAKEQQREANAGTTASARVSRTRNASDPLLFQPLVVEEPGAEDEDAGADGSEPSDCKNRASSIALTASDSPLPAHPELGVSRGAATAASTRRHTGVSETAGDGSSSGGDIFFPPLRPAVRKREEYQLSNDAPPVTRWKYLRRCYRSLLILYIGIIAAATIYLVIAARLAVSIYGSFLVGPDEPTYLVATSHQPTAWAAVFFGTLTLGAVFFRFADSPSGQSTVTRKSRPSSSGPGRRGGEGGKSVSPRRGDEAALPGAQVLSRSLPAVPESEGAIPTVSQQLLSQHGGGGGGDRDEVDAARANLAKMPSSPSMKFQLRKSQRRPDAIVILPVGSETNSYANLEDQTRSTRSMRGGGGFDDQTASKRSWRGLMGRYGSSSRALARGVPEDVTQGSLMTEEMGAASRPEFIMLDVPTLSESGAAQQDTAARDPGKSSESFADPLLSPQLAQPGSPQVDGASIKTVTPAQPRRSSSQRRIPVAGRYDQDEQFPMVTRRPSIPTRAPPADYYRGGDQLGRQVSPMGTAQPYVSQSAGFYPSQSSGWPASAVAGPSSPPASSSSAAASPSLYASVPRDMMYPPSSQVYAFAGASPSRATKRLPPQEPASPTNPSAPYGAPQPSPRSPSRRPHHTSLRSPQQLGAAGPFATSPTSPSLASWRTRLSSSNGGELPRRPEAPNQPLPPSPADLAYHRARLSSGGPGESPHEGSFRGWPYVKSSNSHLSAAFDDGAAQRDAAAARGHAKKPSYDFF